MNGKKWRRNGDNSRDHSSHEPFETGCTARGPYLRHTHLPDSVSGYRKRLVKKGIRTPPSRIYQEYSSLHPFDRGKPSLSRRGMEARLRVNLEQAPAFRPESREVTLHNFPVCSVPSTLTKIFPLSPIFPFCKLSPRLPGRLF